MKSFTNGFIDLGHCKTLRNKKKFIKINLIKDVFTDYCHLNKKNCPFLI